MTSTATPRSTKTRVGAGLLAGAALLAGVGAFANFTDTEEAGRAIDAGQLDIQMGGDLAVTDVAPGDIWSTPLTIDVPAATNDGELIESIDLSIDPGAGEVLGQHMDNGVAVPGETESIYSGAAGLRLVLQNCSSAWTPVALAPGTFSCGGTITDIEGNTGNSAITGADSGGGIVSSTKIDSLTAGTVNYTAADFGETPTATGTIPDGATLNLLATFVLPGDTNDFGSGESADNSYENAELPDMTFVAVANQRAGIEK